MYVLRVKYHLALNVAYIYNLTAKLSVIIQNKIGENGLKHNM